MLLILLLILLLLLMSVLELLRGTVLVDLLLLLRMEMVSPAEGGGGGSIADGGIRTQWRPPTGHRGSVVVMLLETLTMLWTVGIEVVSEAAVRLGTDTVQEIIAEDWSAAAAVVTSVTARGMVMLLLLLLLWILVALRGGAEPSSIALLLWLEVRGRQAVVRVRVPAVNATAAPDRVWGFQIPALCGMMAVLLVSPAVLRGMRRRRRILGEVVRSFCISEGVAVRALLLNTGRRDAPSPGPCPATTTTCCCCRGG